MMNMDIVQSYWWWLPAFSCRQRPIISPVNEPRKSPMLMSTGISSHALTSNYDCCARNAHCSIKYRCWFCKAWIWLWDLISDYRGRTCNFDSGFLIQGKSLTLAHKISHGSTSDKKFSGCSCRHYHLHGCALSGQSLAWLYVFLWNSLLMNTHFLHGFWLAGNKSEEC